MARLLHVLRALSASALFFLSCCTAPDSAAYVRARRDGTGPLVKWRQVAPLRLSLDVSSIPEALEPDDVKKALGRATAAWNEGARACSRVSLVLGETLDPADGGTRDGANTVVFHEARFCRAGADMSGHCYDPRRAAVTTLHHGAALPDGEVEIEEADIEINAVTFDWHGAGARGSALERLLLHELGHVLGLAHSCEANAVPGVPRCDPAKPLTDGLMAPGSLDSSPAEIARALGSAERKALCDLYPGAEGSRSTGGGHRWLAGAGVAAVAVWCLRRRHVLGLRTKR